MISKRDSEGYPDDSCGRYATCEAERAMPWPRRRMATENVAVGPMENKRGAEDDKSADC